MLASPRAHRLASRLNFRDERPAEIFSIDKVLFTGPVLALALAILSFHRTLGQSADQVALKDEDEKE